MHARKVAVSVVPSLLLPPAACNQSGRLRCNLPASLQCTTARHINVDPCRDMEDEVENLDEDLQLGGASHYAPGAGAAGGAGGSAGGAHGGPAPWELVRSAAANLPLSHLGREKAGNAEITPLQVGMGSEPVAGQAGWSRKQAGVRKENALAAVPVAQDLPAICPPACHPDAFLAVFAYAFKAALTTPTAGGPLSDV